MNQRALWLGFAALALGGCDVLEDALGDGGLGGAIDLVSQCTDVCTKIEQCGATPPKAAAGNLSEDLPENDAVACATNCIQAEQRARLGYSDCQIECIQQSACGEVNNCWVASSPTYARHCNVPEPRPVRPPEENPPPIDNGSETGNDAVDELLEDPAINDAVNESDTIINFGDDPPELLGLYSATGSIDRANNARPVGNPINTQVCFLGLTSINGSPNVNYCERGIAAQSQAPVTGSGDSFTVYFDFRPDAQVTILFSGTFEGDASARDVEALVTYTHALEVWEHSVTQWTREQESCSCPF